MGTNEPRVPTAARAAALLAIILAAVLVVTLGMVGGGCGSGSGSGDAATTTSVAGYGGGSGDDPASAAGTGEQDTTIGSDTDPDTGDGDVTNGNPRVELKTSMGTMVLELDAAAAPISVENFLSYVEDGSYDGTIFHRVIPGFMAQGGGFTPDMTQKPTKSPIKNEAANGLKNLRGTLAMARTGVVDSATAQFFVNVVDNAFLDHTAATPQGYGYAVFGKVVSGMEVVDAMVAVPTKSVGPMQDVPQTPIVIESASVLAAE